MTLNYIIIELILSTGMKFDRKIAETLYLGVVSDSDRFLISYTTAKTFHLVAKLIEYLEHSGYEVVNYGTDDVESVDFPAFAKKLGNGVINKDVSLGIAICGTGIGMSIIIHASIITL